MLTLTFIGFSLFSISYNILGPLTTNIMETTGLSLPQAGGLLSAQQAGAVLSILLILLIQKKTRLTTIIRLGYSMIILSFALIALVRMNTFLFIAYAMLGFGSFLIDSGSNSYIASAYFEKRGAYISLLHFAYGAAALLAGYLILPFKNRNWPLAYASIALLFLIILILHKHTDMRHQKKGAAHDETQDPVLPLLKDIPFILYTLVIFFYMGSQISCAAWIPVYVETELGGSSVMMATSLMMFWIGTSLSRLLVSFILAKGGKPFTLSLWGMILAGVALIASTSTGGSIPAVLIFTGLNGFFAGATIPMYIVVASSWFPRNTTFISLSYILSGTVGRMIIPVAITILAEHTTLAFSLRTSSILLFVSALLIFIVRQMTKDRENGAAPPA